MFDVFLFHVPYTTMQYVGLGFLFSLYIFQGLKFVLWDLPKERKREAAVKEEVEKFDKALIKERNMSRNDSSNEQAGFIA